MNCLSACQNIDRSVGSVAVTAFVPVAVLKSMLLPACPALQARSIGRGHMTKHIGLAKKVVEFLSSRFDLGAPERQRYNQLSTWLSTLETQFYHAMPSSAAPRDLPEFSEVLRWSNSLTDAALASVDKDMEEHNTVTAKTARKVWVEAWVVEADVVLLGT